MKYVDNKKNNITGLFFSIMAGDIFFILALGGLSIGRVIFAIDRK